jgi:putative endonuclease
VGKAVSAVVRSPARRDRSQEPATRCFVYVIACRSETGYRTYVGWTTDLDRRLHQHNSGAGAKSTRGRNWVLLYAECWRTRREAMSREWHLKHDRNFRRTLRTSS